MDSVSSTTFIKRPPRPARREESLFIAKDILLNRLFLGNYLERRHVAEINDYRDVIRISTAETELIADLDKIRHGLYRDGGAKWVGITGPEFENALAGHCLWVKLTNIPFGRFWFQIKQVKCENEEIIFRLKCVRPARVEDYGDAVKEEKKMKEKKEGDEKNCNEKSPDYAFEFDPAQKLAALYIYLNEAVRQMRPHLTWENFILVSKFIFAMAFVLLTAFVTCIQYAAEYGLRLIRELAFVLQAISPVLIQAMDCVTRAIGGLFLLVALLFRTRYAPQQFPSQFQPQRKFLALPQRPQESVVVDPRPRASNSTIVISNDWRERNRALQMQLLS